MKIGITGHTSGIGKAIFEMYPDIIGWSRTNGYDINEPDKIIKECKNLDVVINNAHDGFAQISFLYKLSNNFDGKIINIGSVSGDGIKSRRHVYAVEKTALDKASEQLYYLGCNITNLRLGLTDTPRMNKPKWKNREKMPTEYVVNIIDWILKQPYRVKEITVEPKK